MRQVWITRTGSPDVLAVKEAPDPIAGKGEARIRVRASGINFADLMARVGLYPDAPKLPCVVGYEVSGTIDQVGEGVTEVAVGDRVLAMCKFGGYSDVVTVPASQAIKMSDTMSFEEGAAFPVVYATAYNMMLWNGHLRPGSSVLIHSAAGGVGIAAIQIAKTRGCVIIGTASPSKHAFLKELGCHHPIDSSGDYAPAVRAIVGDKGVDLILDAVGGKSWTAGYDLLAPCGRLVAFGLSSAASGNTRSIFHALAQVLSIKKWSPMTSSRSSLRSWPCTTRASSSRTSTGRFRSPRPRRLTSTSTTARRRGRCCSSLDGETDRQDSPGSWDATGWETAHRAAGADGAFPPPAVTAC
jgi:synaptic vesicle membrane protein VAT-1